MKTMKSFLLVLAVVLAVSASGFAQAATESAASAPNFDDKYLKHYMEETSQQFLASIDGLTEEQWKFKASPESWSIAEAAEHIALTEAFFNGMISGMLKTPGEAGMKEKVQGKEEMVLKNIAVVTQKAQAPEPVKPAGKYASKAELVEAFESMRAANLKMLAEHSGELREHFSDGPVGPLDAYQWLMFTAAHSRRHTTQIENVKAASGYPKT